MHILIADDDALSRRVLERAIHTLGHTSSSVDDGDAAWARLEQGGIDVVISDWLMPGVDGLELCRRVRARGDQNERYVYFIILSALSDKADFVRAMEAQADDFLTKPFDRTDLQVRLNVAQRFTTLYRQLASQRAALEAQKREVDRLNQELYFQARTDPLTQVGNRLQLREDLETLRARVDRYGHSYAIAIFDIDHFKQYNDHYGHPAGDDVLRTVAARIKECIRLSDAIYRYGGEEFLVVLPEQTLEQAALAGERLRAAVEDLRLPHAGITPAGTVTISVGISVLVLGEERSIATVLQRADEALYRAKQAGRNRVSVYHQTVHQPAPATLPPISPSTDTTQSCAAGN